MQPTERNLLQRTITFTEKNIHAPAGLKDLYKLKIF